MSKSKCISWLIVLSAALASVAAVAQDRGPVRGETFVIELDIFSGRPNPRLVLDDPAEVMAFTQKMKESCDRASAVRADAAPEYPGILGYRGMLVSRSMDGGAAERSFSISGGSMRMAKQHTPLACQSRTNGLAADAAGDVHLLGMGLGLEHHVVQLALQKGVIDTVAYQVILQGLSAR